MIKGYTTIPPGPSRLGTDLTGHHPVSFTYDSALAIAKGELEDPSKLQGRVRLDTAGQLQCTSCHDPHSDQNGKFLVENNTASALCVECHALNNWSSSVHAISPAGWNGTGRNPWPNSKSKTVAANGCENCHASHAAGVQPHLLKFAKPEDNCLVCHNGSVAAKNIEGEFNKKSAHGLVSFSSPRDAAQGPVKASEPHVACVDCHDPHTVGKATAASGSAPAALGQVKGVAADGAVVKIVTHEYELCFRCHAGTSALGNSKAPRQFMQPNIRLQFEPANASYHPVLNPPRIPP
jgi:predicted CXXCH cytochrome family protein